MPWILIILTWFTVHRATRLLTRDHLPIIAVPRQKIVLWLDPVTMVDGIPIAPAPKRPLGLLGWSFAFLLECDWCMSVWIAAGVVALEVYTFDLNVPYPILLAASASTITGLIAQREPE